MNSASIRPFAVAVLCFLPGLALSGQTNHSLPTPRATTLSPTAQANYGKLPLSFEPNVGQTSSQVQWLARGIDYTLFLSGHDAVLDLNKRTAGAHSGDAPSTSSSVIRMNLVGANPSPKGHGEQPEPGKANYLTGTNPAGWQQNVGLYGRVHLESVYPGVDLAYYGSQGQLEYDFMVAPGADPSTIRLAFEGTTPHLADTGDLVLPVNGSEARFNQPVVYQMVAGKRQLVESSFVIAKNGDVSFRLGAYDHARALVIDPKLVYTGTFGTGNMADAPAGMAVDANGELIITGSTRDTDFPATVGAYQTSCGPMSTIATQNGYARCTPYGYLKSSAYVAKLSADGTHLIYATYLHGFTGWETGAAVQADASGNAVVVGQTASDDFPLVHAPSGIPQMSVCNPLGSITPTGATQVIETCSGYFAGGGTEWVLAGPSGYIAKLSADGSTLLYSAYMGFSGATYPQSLALDASGNMYMLNEVNIAFPVTNSNPFDVFYLTTPSAFQAVGQGDYETALTVLSADGQSVLYSTIFGETQPINSTCGSCLNGTVPSSIAVGQNGTVFIAGETRSSTLPQTVNAAQSSCITVNATACAQPVGFVAAFNIKKSGASSLEWASYVSGPANPNTGVSTQLNSITADAQNNVYLTGYTTDALFPVTTGAYESKCIVNTRGGANYCDNSVFVSKLDASGAYVWSTFLTATEGAGSSANSNGIALDSQGKVYVYGDSGNLILPAVNPLSQYPNDWYQPYPFLTVLDPTGSNVVFSSQIAPNNYVSSMINGLALDSAGNIYMVGNTQGQQSYYLGNTIVHSWPTTKGTYSTPFTGSASIPFFVKLSPVLPIGVTSLTITPTTTTTDQPVTFDVTVSGVTNGAMPTGSVALSYTTTGNTTPTQFETLPLGASGTSTFTSTSLAVGTYTFTGVYSGDTNYDGSTSSTASVTINTPAAATLSLKSSGSPVTVGASVTFTATTTGTKGTPTGTVTFMNGATTLGTALLNGSGIATYSTSFTKAGTYNITASYGGDTTFGTAVSSAVSEVVTTPIPTVTLASSAAKASAGYNVTFTATVAGSGAPAPTGTVTFLDGSKTLGTGTLSGGTATYSTASLAVGSHSITASYGGDTNYGTAVSTALTETIVTAAFTVSYNPTPVVIKQGSSGTTTITVTPGAAYSGTVTFGCSGAAANITCSFAPASLNWTASNSTSAQTAIITIQTTAPHAAVKAASLWAGTWLGSLMACFSLLVLTRTRKLALTTRTLMLVVFLLGSVGALAGLTGCGGAGQNLIGGTPTGAQSLSITFNGTDNGTPLGITVQ